MVRALAAAAVTALAFGSPAAVAGAEPASGGCNYTLTPLRVVNVSGVDMVTTSITIGACDRAVTYQTVACIQMAGASGPGQCVQSPGIVPAQVYYQPYQPGATYTATGRGCASKGNPPQRYCQESGPVTASL